MEIRDIEEIAERLAGMLPPQAGPVRDELRDNFRAVLKSQLSRLDLVPREEFDAARDMLAHTREKLDELEQQVAALEAADNAPNKAPNNGPGGTQEDTRNKQPDSGE